MNRRWVIAVAGLACSHATTLPVDGGSIGDTGRPAADAADDLAALPDLAGPEAAAEAGPPGGDDAAIDVAPDLVQPADVAASSLAVDPSAFFFAETAIGCESTRPAVMRVSNGGPG